MPSSPSVAPVATALYQDPKVHARRWWTLGVLCLSLMIVMIGNSSLNVTIPTLSKELHATQSQLQWVIAAYSLAFAGLLFSTGAIGDRFGRKGALQFGLIVFLVGVVGATFSAEMWQLIAARVVMGVGAAFIMPSTLSILVNVFPPEERTKAIASWAAVTGAAGSIGPVASGFLLSKGFWYGAVFLVNVPFLVLALGAGYVLVPKSKDPEQGKLDPVGAILSIVGICGLVYGLIEAPDKGWTGTSTLIAFGIGLLGLVAFVLWERRQEEPMLDIRYFKNPAFSTGTTGMILVFMSMYGVMFLITQYFQLILGYTPLDSAIRLLPMAPIMIIVAPLTPRLSARFGANRVVSVGLLLIAFALLGMRGLDLDTSYWFILAFVFPMVTGMALAMSPMTSAIMSAVPARRAGAGSAMNDATRELGAALGVAVMGSVAASHYSSNIDTLTTGLSPEMQEAARTSLAQAMETASHLPGQIGQTLLQGAEHSFVDGVHGAVTTGAVLCAIAAVIVFKYLPAKLAHSEHGAVDAGEPGEPGDALDVVGDVDVERVDGLGPISTTTAAIDIDDDRDDDALAEV